MSRELFRPHMVQRKGESVEQWRDRLERSCYRCGQFEPSSMVLDAHEAVCDGTPPGTRRQS